MDSLYVFLAHDLEEKSFEILAKRLSLSVYAAYSSSFAQTHNIELRLTQHSSSASLERPLIFASGANLPSKLSLHLDADLHCPCMCKHRILASARRAFLHRTDDGLPTRKQILPMGLGKEFDCIYSVFYLRNMPVIFKAPLISMEKTNLQDRLVLFPL